MKKIKKADACNLNGYVGFLKPGRCGELGVKLIARIGDQPSKRALVFDTVWGWDLADHCIARVIGKNQVIVGIAFGAAFEPVRNEPRVHHKDRGLNRRESGWRYGTRWLEGDQCLNGRILRITQIHIGRFSIGSCFDRPPFGATSLSENVR